MNFSQQSESGAVHQTLILGHSGGNSCHSYKAAIAPATLRLAEAFYTWHWFFPSCQAGSCILLVCRQDLRDRKCFRNFSWVFKGLLCRQERIPAVPPGTVGIFSLWSEFSSLNSGVSDHAAVAGCRGSVTSQRAGTGKEKSCE